MTRSKISYRHKGPSINHVTLNFRFSLSPRHVFEIFSTLPPSWQTLKKSSAASPRHGTVTLFSKKFSKTWRSVTGGVKIEYWAWRDLWTVPKLNASISPYHDFSESKWILYFWQSTRGPSKLKITFSLWILLWLKQLVRMVCPMFLKNFPGNIAVMIKSFHNKVWANI